MISIHDITTKRGIRDFINYPYQLYANNSSWVPQLRILERKILNTVKHPFYTNVDAKFYIAKKDNKIKGRIASIYDRTTKKGYFGFLHADDDLELFKHLFEQVEKDLQKKNVTQIIGPVSPSINYQMGVLIEGFLDSPFIMMPYNHAYYDNHIQSSGYSKVKDFQAYFADRSDIIIPEKIVRVRNTVKKKFNVSIRNPNMKDFLGEIKRIEEIYNDAMSVHWGFVHMDSDEFSHLARQLVDIIDPKMVLIAEIENEPIGFIMCLPNYNEVFKRIKKGKLFPLGIFKYLMYRRTIEGLRVVTLGVVRKFQSKGIGSLLYFQAIKNMLKSNYRHVEFSWIMEDNQRVKKIAELIGTKKYKSYRLYGKQVLVK